jgi:multidrug efflux pump
MASSVATPLERQFGRIAGINEMTSVSQRGSTNITMQFDLNRDINGAARDVQASINASLSQLPAGLPTNPRYRKVNPADAPIMILALTSDTMTRPRVYDIADSILAQKLSQVEGVGQVFVGGSAQPAVRIEANPLQLNALGIGLDQLRGAINAQNVLAPKGSLASGTQSWTVTANDQLKTADEYRPIIVAYQNGAPVRIGDVADVQDSLADVHNAGRMNGKDAILMIISRQPGANIIATVDRVKAVLPQLQASVPPTVNIAVALDRTTTIRASVRDVQRTLMISISLVVLVVFFFLRNARATFIPSVAVPLSIVGTFGVMYLLDYTIDNLSLMAITISTGFVVDDAIVVLENIMRHIEAGMSPREAALLGAREIGPTIVTISISLVAVFIPILLMGGLVGRLFREFAVTLSTAIVISMLVSLSATPMLCSELLRHVDEGQGWFYRVSERFFEIINNAYKACLLWILRHSALALLLTFAIIGLNVMLYVVVPKGFFPQQDTGRLGGSIQAQQDIGFDAMNEKVQVFAAIVKRDPAVENVVAFAGGGQTSANSGRMFVTLKPLSERPGRVNADAVVNRLRPKLAVVPGATLFLQSAQELQIGGRQGNAQFQYSIQSENLDDLREWAPKLLEKLRHVAELRDVNTDQQNRGLEQDVIIDRDTAARLGITPALVDAALYDSYGQRQVSTIYQALNQYHVVLEADPRYTNTPDSLSRIYVRANNGRQVPLSTFVHFQTTNTALAVNHQGQFPATTITFNLAPGLSLGQATTAVQNAEREIRLPGTIHGSFQGSAAAFQQSLDNQLLLITAALIAVYIVLGILYESYIHPITILSTLPSAGLGALLALLITGTDLTVIAVIGIILLIGIVKKNAIMMIDFAQMAERRGKTSEESIVEAALLRFRPITMTTMAALLGAMPLALGRGTGSELRRPLGIAIVGGLLVSQMVTLFTTPVIYLYLDQLQNWWRGKRHAEHPAATPEASTAD